MGYETINWKDAPKSYETPIMAENLNHMDDQIAKNSTDIEGAVTDVAKAKTDANYAKTVAESTEQKLDGYSIKVIRQSEYEAMESHDNSTIYFIRG